MPRKNLWFSAGFLVLLILAGIITMVAPVKSDQEIKRVKVMVVLPTSIEIGQEMVNAIQLAIDEANGKAGEIEVEIVIIDDYDPQDARNFDKDEAAAQQAAADETVVAFLCCSNTSRTRRVVEILNQANIVTLSPGTTWPGFTMPGFGIGEPGIYYPTGRRTFFRVVPNDSVQGIAATRWMSRQGYREVFILKMQDPYSIGLAGIVEANAADHDLNIIGQEIFDPIQSTDEEIAQLIDRILESGAKVVYYPLPNTGSGYRFITMLLEADPNIIIIGGDGLLNEPMPENQENLDRIYATTVQPTGFEAAQPFMQAYQQAYGDPNPRPYVLTSYETMQVILKAIAEAEEPTREGVLDAMHHLGSFSGAMGTWSFDANGDTTFSAIAIMTIQDGTWVAVDVVE